MIARRLPPLILVIAVAVAGCTDSGPPKRTLEDRWDPVTPVVTASSWTEGERIHRLDVFAEKNRACFVTVTIEGEEEDASGNCIGPLHENRDGFLKTVGYSSQDALGTPRFVMGTVGHNVAMVRIDLAYGGAVHGFPLGGDEFPELIYVISVPTGAEIDARIALDVDGEEVDRREE